ncbi:MAG: hypothetical protein ITD33_02140 [Nitrosarchaeum sp.]|nr:hypothetical protein [Nitrosarchaeum sp.]MBP0119651.1 hypothetical protein [Nitrosarchaeum sp.]MBP0134330.1 hypothetical protein [Nitrosarchaeum sp.]MSV26597.1 hypothetical protein [Nitrosarchaeum sp.]PHY08556.1 MAG: hypothetical protein CK527_06000 [Nitrosarchaeum sp.]
MGSILWFAIGIAIVTAILGSLFFSFLSPNSVSSEITLETKCETIAKEGFKIHTMYPDSQPDQLPLDDMNRLMYLDDLWINECISHLSAKSIFNIIQKVEHDFYAEQ